MPNSIARRALASFAGKLLSAPVITASLLLAFPATAQQSALISSASPAVYGPPEQFTAMFTDASQLAGLLRRQGVSDAEAAAVENGVRKALSERQRKAGAILQLYFTGHYGARSLDRVSVDPATGSTITLTRATLGLPAATTAGAATQPAPTPAEPAATQAAATQPVAKPVAPPAEKPAPQTVAQPAPQPAPQPAAQPAAPQQAAAPAPVVALPPQSPVDIAEAQLRQAFATPPKEELTVGSSGGAAPSVMAQPAKKTAPAFAPRALTPGLARAIGVVNGDGDALQAMRAAGLPQQVAREAHEAARRHPALQYANLDGALFEVVYNPALDATAGITLAAFHVEGREHRVWRFVPASAPPGLFTEQGERLTGLVLRSPMPGIEINSPFGMRKHPVLRVPKFHWGIDLPAPTGTPIYAAADGVITDARRNGNYGLFMRIDHGEGIATTYGHMSRFGKGMKPGTRVRAGEVIAHVGRTGLSTGPHLYFEVFMGERRVDPEPLIAEGGKRLLGSDLVAFERAKLQSGFVEIASESRN